jgi:hypothetical protein
MKVLSALEVKLTLKEAATLRPARERNLVDSINTLIRHFGLTIETHDQLFKDLSYRPPHILWREYIVACDLDPNKAELPTGTLDQDGQAALFTAGTANWSVLERSQRDKAGKKYRRFLGKWTAFRSGNPRYPYTDLVIRNSKIIETAVGKPFGHTRDPYADKNILSGPMLDTLIASLTLVLFASGAPKASTVIPIIRKERLINNKEHGKK